MTCATSYALQGTSYEIRPEESAVTKKQAE
jgi:hypothetical protein